MLDTHDVPETKNILFIDNDLSVRFVLKKLLCEHFPYTEVGVDIYTASTGVEGLGLVFSVKSDVIVLDTCLPQYGGLNILDYITSNDTIIKSDPKIILLYKDGKPYAPEKFVMIDKQDPHFAEKVLEEVKQKINPVVEHVPKRREKWLLDLGRGVIKFADISDDTYWKVKDSKTIIAKIGNSFTWILCQVLVSFFLTIFYILGGGNNADTNVQQHREDILKFRMRYYPTIAISLTIATIITIRALVFLTSIISFLNIGLGRVQAATVTWDGGGATNNWSDCVNWTLNTCPVSGDTVTFDGTSGKNATIDASFAGTINTLNINAAYGGTITVGRSFTVSSGLTQSGGTFNGAGQAIVFGYLTLNNGSFTASSANMSISTDLNISATATFNANGGSITFNGGGTQNLTCNNAVFNSVIVSRSNYQNLFRVYNGCNLPLGNNPTVQLGITSGYTDFYMYGTLTGTGTLTLTGGPNSTFLYGSGAALSGFTGLVMPAGFSLNVASTALWSGFSPFTYSVGSLTIGAGGNLSLPNNSYSIGSYTQTGGTFTSTSANLSISGDFSVSGTTTFNANGGSITFNGGGTQNLTCNNAVFNSVIVSRSNYQNLFRVYNGCNLPLGNNPTVQLGITSGYTDFYMYGTLTGTGTLTLTGGPNSTFLYGSGAALSGFTGLVMPAGFSLNVASTALWSSFSPFTYSGGGLTVAAGGNLSLPANNYSITYFSQTGGTFTSTSANLNVSGDFSISGTTTFNANGGSITFNGSSSQNVTCNNAVFNSVFVSRSNYQNFFRVYNGCNLPLGNNPTVQLGITSGYTDFYMYGTLTGTGTLTLTGGPSSTFTFGSGAVLNGFTGLVMPAGFGLSIASTASWSSFSPFTYSGGGLTVLAGGNLSLPANNYSITYYSQTGGTFTSTSANLNVSGDFSISGTTTFNANGGIITFNGNGSQILTCNNAVFNSVVVSRTNYNDQFRVNNGCNLPLGNNPTVQLGSAFGYTDFYMYGTLTGTGTLTLTGGPTSTFTFGSGAVLNGLTGLVMPVGFGLSVASMANWSSFSPFTYSGGGLTVAAGGNLSLPANNYSITYFSQTGGTFTSTSANLNVSGDFSISGTTAFNANGGTITFNGNGSQNVTCNNVVFNSVVVSRTNYNDFFRVYNGCNLPLGNNPTVQLGSASGYTDFYVYGTLTGTGTLTLTGGPTSALYWWAGATLNGLTGLVMPTGFSLNVSTTADWSSLSPFNFNNGSLTINSGANFTLPSAGTINATSFSQTGGTFTSSAGTLNISNSFTISGTTTFNHNNGIVNFTGNGVTLSCNNVTFNLVTLNNTGTITVNNNCTLPLGNNATIANGITLNGTLSGSGTVTMTTGTLTLNAGSVMSGFGGLTGTSNAMTISGATANFSTYSPMTLGGAFTLSSGTLTAPSNNLSVGGNLTISGTPTFNTNGGTVTAIGGTATWNCINYAFNNVVIAKTTGHLTVSSNCNLPLGANPTIATGTGDIVYLYGTLSGSGTITYTNGQWLVLESTAVLTGFSGLNGPSLQVSGMTANLSSYSPFTLTGDFYVDSGSLTLPSSDLSIVNFTVLGTGVFTSTSGTLNVAGNFVHTTGTFNHNNGTINFNGTNQTITGTTTFKNLSKVMSSGPAQTLTFPNTLTQTVLGSLVFHGFDLSNRLLLRSSSTNSQWKIDAQGSRDMLYVDVKDSNSINATVIEMGGSGSTDSGNNIHYSFGDLVPNTPTNLGPANVISAIIAPTTRPVFTFGLSDPNFLDTVQYNIQIDDNGDFSSPVVNYTSALLSQGNKSFTVGQGPGGGTYTAGSSGQSLTTGSYYWKINAKDDTGLSSAYVYGNSGSVAFLIDSDPPAAFTPTLNVTSPTTNRTPTVTFNTTDNVGVDHYQIKVDSGSFVTHLSPYTIPTPLTAGDHTITVRAIDTSGNYTDGTVNVNVIINAPAPFTPTLNVPSPTTDQTPIVSFSTTDDAGIDHYDVKIDSGSFVTQTSPYQLPTLVQGSHTITVRAYNINGLTTDGVVSVIVDLTNPYAFTPTLNVGAYTTNQTPTLSFSTNDNVGVNHYEVSIDSGSFSTQTSPYVLPTLAEGSHSIIVRAFDGAGNHRDGTTLSTTVDLTAPNAFTPTLDVTSPTSNTRPTVTFSTTDNFVVDHYAVGIDGGSFTTQTSPYQVPSLAQGNHTITVRAYDAVSNYTDGNVGIIIDENSPAAFTPTLNVTSPTNNQTPILGFVTTDDNGVDHYDVKIDSGLFTTQSSPYQLPTLSEQAHTITVRAYDASGNYTDGSVNVTVDITRPNSFTPYFSNGSITKDTTPTLIFTTTDTVGMSHFEVSIDSGPYVSQTSPYDLPGQADGVHAVIVRAYDNAGNYREASPVSITIDTQAPAGFTPSLNVTSPTQDVTPIVSFSTTDNVAIAYYWVKVDNGSFSTQISPYQLPALTEATHTITVRAVDTAGNTTDGSVTIVVDNTPPAVFTPTLDVADPTNNPRPTLSFATVDDNGINHYEVKIDSGSFSTQTSPYQLPTLSQTNYNQFEHTITVRAYDNTGIFTDGSVNIAVDTTAPTIYSTVVRATNNTDITNTTFSITDNLGMNLSDVTATGGTLHCTSYSWIAIGCSSVISQTGTYSLHVIDRAGNASSVDLPFVIETIPPVITINAPTKTSSSTITDTTITVTDNYWILADNVRAISGGTILCGQTSQTRVDCISSISDTGNLQINATDNAGNAAALTESGYYINSTPPAPFTPTLNTTPYTSNTAPILFFSTTDADGVDHYEVKIDEGAFTRQVSPYQMPVSSAGFHTITIRAYDTLGNFRDEVIGLTIDAIPPADFTPTLNVVSPTTNTTPIVSFTTTDNIGIDHYEVQIDSGSFTTRTSPYQLPTLTEGGHTITVRAFDAAGNSTDSRVDVTIDTSGPAAFTPTLDVSSPTNNDTPAVSFFTTDPGGISHYELKVDSGGFTSQSSPYQLPILSEGDHTITVRAFDNAGNHTDGSVSVTIDITPPAEFTPTLNVTSPTNNDTPTITYSTTDNLAISHYELKIDGGTFVTHFSPYTLAVLSGGQHTITVRAFDTAGNTRDESVAVSVDVTGPAAFTPTLNVTSPTNITTPTVSFFTTDNVAVSHYDVKVDSGAFSTQVSPYLLPALSEGDHVITVRAFDAAGNFSDGTVAVTIDITPPAAFTPTLNVAATTANASPTVAFATTDNVAIGHYEVQIDSGIFSTQSSPFTTPHLADGDHVITVVAFDTAGNSRSGSVAVRVDTSNPVITILAPTRLSKTTITDTTVSISDNTGIDAGSISATGGILTCAQTSLTQVDCTVIISLSGTLVVTATDSSENSISESAAGYIIDSEAPVITIAAPTRTSTTAIIDTTVRITDNVGVNAAAVDSTGGTLLCTQTSTTEVDCTVSISASGTLTVHALDLATNSSTASESGYLVSGSFPAQFTPVLNTGPYTNNTAPIVSYSTTSPDGVNHYEVKVDTGTFSAQTSPYQLPELAEGFHTITVRAFGNNGNFTDGAVNVTIDLNKPADLSLTLDVPSPTNNRRPTIRFAASDPAGIDHYEVKVASSGGEFTNQVSPYQLPELEEGTHVITVKAIDFAGNFNIEAVGLVEDITPPTGTIVINNNDEQTKSSRVTLSMTTNDNLSGVREMMLSENKDFQGASFEPYSDTKSWIFSNSGGIKTVYVKFKDRAGNVSTVYSDSIKYVISIPELPQTGTTTPTTVAVPSIDLSNAVPAILVVASTATAAANLIAYPRIFLYGLFIIRTRKRYKAWGVVYDDASKQPIQFATVRIYSGTGNVLIAERVTDLDGKYGFVLDRGSYQLVVEHSDYLKHQEAFVYDQPEGALGKDIALNRSRVVVGNFASRLREKLRTLNAVMVYGGFVFSVVSLLFVQNLVNLLVVGLYLGQFAVLYLLGQRVKREWGYVYNAVSGQRLKGAFVRVYDVRQGRQVDVVMTDETGRYSFRLDDGTYLIIASADGYHFPSSKQDQAHIFRSPSGQVFLRTTVEKGKVINLIIPLDPAA